MVPEIDQEAFAASVEEGDVLVVDVREVHEYLRGHVPNAWNLPLSLLPTQLAELPKERPVCVICQSGNRSAHATALMRSAGIQAANVAGGTAAWITAGRPIRTVAV